jgi:CheY-like chemotaxis protein
VNTAGQMLERFGYQVEARMNPVEAFELFRSKPDQFDLVLTDMTMPQMTGVKLAEKLKVIRPDVPIIICTGYSSLVDEEKAKEIGIGAIIMKPFVMREIATTIRKVLDEIK